MDSHSSYFKASWRPETLKNVFPIPDYPYLDPSHLEIKQNLKKSPSAVLEIFVGFLQVRCLNRGFQVWRIHFFGSQVSSMLRLRFAYIFLLERGGNLKPSKTDSPYLITPILCFGFYMMFGFLPLSIIGFRIL